MLCAAGHGSVAVLCQYICCGDPVNIASSVLLGTWVTFCMLCCSSYLVFATATGASGTASSQEASEAELEAIAGYWQCRHCTSANKDLGSTACEVCGNAKQATA